MRTTAATPADDIDIVNGLAVAYTYDDIYADGIDVPAKEVPVWDLRRDLSVAIAAADPNEKGLDKLIKRAEKYQ